MLLKLCALVTSLVWFVTSSCDYLHPLAMVYNEMCCANLYDYAGDGCMLPVEIIRIDNSMDQSVWVSA